MRSASLERIVTDNQHSVADTQLRAGALKLPAVLIQGVTHIAPAVGLVLSIQYITSLSGMVAPLAYAVAVVIILALGISLAQLARHLPSAGGYYTYISRTVHPRAGFLSIWLYLLYDPTATAINIAFMGIFFQRAMLSEYGVRFPWWVFFLVTVSILTFVVYRGIAPSTNAMVVFGAVEVLIVTALACWGLIRPGPGGINLHSYAPGHASSLGGLALGVVFSIFSVAGFDGVVPLAEESEDPRRTLPRAILASIIFTGAFYLFCSWAVLIGWGTHDVNTFSTSSENPCFVLARRFWGGAWILVLIAVLNSVFAVSIASTNAATRVLFALGRSGILPRSLAKVHPVNLTPSNAIWLQTVITLAVGLGLGFWIGPDQEFYFMGVVITLCLVIIYSIANYGVFLYYRGEKRHEFRLWPHVICPLVSSLALVCVAFESIYSLPPPPVRYGPVLVIGWFCVGVVVLIAYKRAGREHWVLNAGSEIHEVAASATTQAK
jgi:amino acid transporter